MHCKPFEKNMFRSAIPILFFLVLGSACSQVTDLATNEYALADLFPESHTAQESDTDDHWTTVISGRDFRFPADHGAHKDYRIEWWYYTGNLEAEDGRRFGYQLTFFRTGLHKEPANPSRWAVRDLYTAHFGLSDIRNKKHYCFQRNSRAGIGQAGANTDQYEVWNGDWKVALSGDDHILRAEDSDVAIDLELNPTKPPVLHGNDGVSKKGPSPGNASYYYSFTRMSTRGTIRIGGQTFKIQGSSWMDHEFSSSFLEPGQLGWDWLAIQLDSGADLMLYRMRREDGTTDPFSSASLVDRSGDVQHLSVTDYTMKPIDTWKSEQTSAVYPLRWRVEIPSLGYSLDIRPAFDQQEMTTIDTTGISYWEGAIDVLGDSADGKVAGRGYMELTGYAGQGLGSVLK
jgi:predicted secreted hydrolase